MRTTLVIQNLKCGGCGNTISNRLNALEDVDDFSVNVEENTVVFTHTKKSTFDIVKLNLASLGYPALGDRNTLGRKTKSYLGCAIGKMGN